MQQEKLPLVSIITVNWNGEELTCDLLRSIQQNNTYNNIEVIVVDNGSRKDPSAALKAVFPDVNVILTGKNLGFSGGNNVGIKASAGEYVFLVNNDTEFTPQLIEGLLEVVKKYPETGMVSPKFHYYFHKGTIEYAGYKPVNIFTGRNGMIGYREIDNGQYNQLTETNYVHGGGMFMPRQVIDNVGLMPEDFFLYYEEFDWSEQVKRKGYKIYYQPASLIYHKESMTTGKMSPLKTFYLTRNRILFMKRNMPLFNYGIFLAYFIAFTIPKNTVTYLFKGQRDHLRSFWKGILWHFNSRITYTI